MLKVLDLFSGIGGFSLGLERTGGFQTTAFCEIDLFCRKVLAKHWPDVPCHEDIKELTADATGPVDVITGGFPCQDISLAGTGKGLSGERSGLWKEFARLICDIRPQYVIVENVSALLSRGLGDLLSDLAQIGYDAEWHCIPASYIGAWHRRDRIWLVANPKSNSPQQPVRQILQQPHLSLKSGRGFARWPGRSNLPKSRFRRDDDGLPKRLDRNIALGNAVVPQVVEQIGYAILEVENTLTPPPESVS